MNPYLQDADVTVYCGHVLDVLRELPDESVHMCCTSPPFYGLRDYGCEGQIGLEATPDEWVQALVEVFREVRRVLRSDGTCWIEIGDSYAGSWGAQSRENGTGQESLSGSQIASHPKGTRTGSIPAGAPYKPKDLIGTPWLLAFALRADGWYLRSEIIWAKPNPMPESVTDRPTTSHSRVFLLAKSKSYYFDAEAIREPQSPEALEKYASGWTRKGRQKDHDKREVREFSETAPQTVLASGRNRRTVWQIPTEPYPEAHFATWPTQLVEPMILAGTSERGVCPVCGAPWERIVETHVPPEASEAFEARRTASAAATGRTDGHVTSRPNFASTSQTVGWQPTCKCQRDYDGQMEAEPWTPVPATVLDPFGGSGTTAHVARKHGRRSILIELNPDYCDLAARRLAQQSLLA